MKNRFAWCISILLVTGVARADLHKGSQMLSLFGGVGFSSSKFEYGVTGGEEEVGDGGGAFGAQWVYTLRESPAVGIGLDASVTELSDRRTLTLVRGTDATTTLRTSALLAIMRLSYPTGRLRPYIFGGLGIHRTKAFISAKPYSTFTWSDTATSEDRVLLDETKTSLAIGYGVGLDLYLTERVFFGAEYRGIALAHRNFDQTPSATSAGLDLHKDSLNVQAILLRLGLQF